MSSPAAASANAGSILKSVSTSTSASAPAPASVKPVSRIDAEVSDSDVELIVLAPAAPATAASWQLSKWQGWMCTQKALEGTALTRPCPKR